MTSKSAWRAINAHFLKAMSKKTFEGISGKDMITAFKEWSVENKVSFKVIIVTESFEIYWSKFISEFITSLRLEDYIKESERITASFVISDIACKKCRAFTVEITEKQTRSGDEGATVFYRCTSCGTKWKSD